MKSVAFLKRSSLKKCGLGVVISKKRALIETSCFASHICCVFLRDRHEKTMGLIAAKKTGGDAAAGDVVVFFDCHVKPRDGWDDAFLKSPVVKNDPHVFNVIF